MILLDTNVVSESLRPSPVPELLAWLDAQAPESTYISTPVLAELYAGVLRLADGRRKDRLRTAIDRIETELFRDRILTFDTEAAKQYGTVTAIRSRSGRPIGQMDALIAAIALSNRAALATRNISDFVGLELELINPFEAPRSTR
jgi:predicted nucleic acid-binding protein